MVAMINNLLQQQITAQLGIGPNHYPQPVVIIDAYIPPADQPDQPRFDYGSTAGSGGGWQLGGIDIASLNPRSAEYKAQQQREEEEADFAEATPIDVTAEGEFQQLIGNESAIPDPSGDRYVCDDTTTALRNSAMHLQQPEAALLATGGGEGMDNMFMDENEEKIFQATVKAFQSGTLTPLIKEELRCTIQSRRLAEGKGELHVEFKSPPKKKDMTDDERKRAVKRRQQNREAAQRFRQKQKDTSDYLSKKIRRLETSSKHLMSDLERLKVERDELQQMLCDHLLVCNNPLINNLSSHTAVTPGVQYPGSSAQEQNHTPKEHQESPRCFFFGDEISQDQSQVDGVYDEVIIDPVAMGFEGSMVDELNGPIDVFYEEEVVEDADLPDSDQIYHRGQQVRSDSCSSSHTGSFYETSPTSYLSESSGSNVVLAHGFGPAIPRTHADSTSSEVFDYVDEDFFLSDECSS